MVDAGEELLSERGYGVTMLDVIERADAPRGSIYYHFPNGKEELAIQVAVKVRHEIDEFVSRTSARIPDPAPFLQRLVENHRKRLVSSSYDLGCPLMGIVASGTVESAELNRAVSDAFGTWISAIARALTDKGFTPEQADSLASLVVTGIEGCIVVGRGKRSPAPFGELSRSIPALVAAVLGADAA